MLLRGKTFGIVGYGRIGRAAAHRARAFGMKVVYTPHRFLGDADERPLNELLIQSDVVSLHCPLTRETWHLIDSKRLGQMKPGAVLINMARGPVVDEAALVAALEAGQLGGAGLDVFEHEPKVHPGLLAMPQVTLSPHLGGGTTQSRCDARRQAAENVADVLHGQIPHDAINQPITHSTRSG